MFYNKQAIILATAIALAILVTMRPLAAQGEAKLVEYNVVKWFSYLRFFKETTEYTIIHSLTSCDEITSSCLMVLRTDRDMEPYEALEFALPKPNGQYGFGVKGARKTRTATTIAIGEAYCIPLSIGAATLVKFINSFSPVETLQIEDLDTAYQQTPGTSPIPNIIIDYHHV